MALALEWAATVMTISAEMVLPGLAGYWVDQQLGTRVLFLLLGFAAGFVLAGLALARIAKKRTVKRDGQGYVRQSNDEHLE
jgi:F0F1-type ATP synthase assembly protein I